MDFKERFKGRTTVMDKQGMLGILKSTSGEPVNKSAIRQALKQTKEYQLPPNEEPNYPPQQPPKFATMNIATRNASSTQKLPSMTPTNYYNQGNGGDRSPKFAGSDPSYNFQQQQQYEYEASTPVHRSMKANGSQKALMSSGGYFIPNNMGSREGNQLQESTSGYMDFNNIPKRSDSMFRRTPDSYPKGPGGDFAGVQQPQSQGRSVLLHNSSNILRNLDARYDYESTAGSNHGAHSPSYGMRSNASLAKSYISHLSSETNGGSDGYPQGLGQSHHWGNGSPQVMRPLNAPDSFKSFEPLTPMNKPQIHHAVRLTNAYSSSEIPKAPQRTKTKA